MKKMAAILLAAALLLQGAAALAKPSIGRLTENVLSLETEIPLSEGLYINIRQADTSSYALFAVRQAVDGVNGTDTAATVRETVQLLADYLPEGARLGEDGVMHLTNADGTESAFDLTAYDFVTPFVDLVVTDGVETAFGDGDNEVSAKTTLAIDAMKGEAALEDYMVLLIAPASGKLWLIGMDSQEYIAETGEITVAFPSLGTFSLIQK